MNDRTIDTPPAFSGLQEPLRRMSTTSSVEWKISRGLVGYPEAVLEMEKRVNGIVDGTCCETVWLLEHPPIYTAGTSARDSDVLESRFPVFKTGRGGQLTYHGPGQRIAYVMLDLKRRRADVREFVCDLEEWLIQTLKVFGIEGERRPGRVGIWVANGVREEKLAAIGVRLRRWVTFHGISLNVNPDLSHYSGIVPCGIKEHGVTSMAALGVKITLEEVDRELKKTFNKIFG